MTTNSVSVNIILNDGAPGPQVIDISAGGAPLVAVQLTQHPFPVSIVVSSAAQADGLARAAAAAKELLSGGQS
jgi:hypothetical protein